MYLHLRKYFGKVLEEFLILCNFFYQTDQWPRRSNNKVVTTSNQQWIKVHDYKHTHVGTRCFVHVLLKGILLNYRFRAVANRLLMAIFIAKLLLEHFAMLNGEFYSCECLLWEKRRWCITSDNRKPRIRIFKYLQLGRKELRFWFFLRIRVT